jgi:hypothetical protein
MNRRQVIVGAPVLVIAGCSGVTAAGVIAGTNDAVNLWGIALGIGQVVLGAAEVLFPGSTTVVDGIEAIIAAASPLVTTAATDVVAAATLTQQANALQLLAAPSVTVLANKT